MAAMSGGAPFTSNVASLVIQFGKPFAKWPQVTLFPSIILLLALVETNRGSLGKKFAFLGDISYSSYLLHFPLQLFLMILILSLSIDQNVFLSSGMLVAFFSVLLPVSYASYHHFELPMQSFLRRQFGHRRAAGSVVAGTAAQGPVDQCSTEAVHSRESV